MANVKKQVEDLVTPIADELGLEIVEVVFEKKYDGMNLTIYIDKKGGVNLDDCEAFHKAIDEPLDELDPTKTLQFRRHFLIFHPDPRSCFIHQVDCLIR